MCGAARVTAASDPIAVVGGKPSWANIGVAVAVTPIVYGGRMVTGRGADTDTMVASARAYVSALNKLMVKRQKTAQVGQQQAL